MGFEKLETAIRKDIDSTEKAISNNARQLLTALNNLLKSEATNKNRLAKDLTERLSELLTDYKKYLKDSNKADVNGYLTRVRNLSKYYIELTTLNTEKMSFSDVLKEGLKRKYGSLDKFYDGDIDPKKQVEIKNKFITYPQVCNEIVEAGIKEEPEIWVAFDINDPEIEAKKRKSAIGAAGRNIRYWITGETVPSSRVPVERVIFIEKYLGLPKNSLVNKFNLLHKKHSIEKIEKKKVTKRETFVARTLNKNFQDYYLEYSNYKIHGTQPTIRNISEQMRLDKYASRRLKVRELQNSKERRWSKGANGVIGAADKFYNTMRGFIHFCVTQRGMALEEVDVHHLTDPSILDELIVAANKGVLSGSMVSYIFTIVKSGSEKKGYLRLCASPGDRTLDEYFDDLDFIIEEFPIWKDQANRTVKEKGIGADKGKENILFLLEKDTEQRTDICNKACGFLVQKSQSNLIEAQRLLKLSENKNRNQKSRDRLEKEVGSPLKRAYHDAMSAMILGVSFENCPRVLNWSMLKYYDSVSAQDLLYSSLTYHRQKNRFKLYIPLYGPCSISGENIRYLKNAEAKNAEKIDIFLSEDLTPIIKNFLNIREYYIKHFLTYKIPKVIEKNNETIEYLKNNSLNMSLDKIEKLIEILSLDNRSYNMFNLDETMPLIVWLTVPKDFSHLKSDYLEGILSNDAWLAERQISRKLHILKRTLSNQFKSETKEAFYALDPNLKQVGVNIHALRHLAAITHLENHPGDYKGAAKIINDDVEQIFKTYGDKSKS